MSHNTYCLNCGKDLNDNYCGNCGQSAATHRFSLKHIFTHDLVHNLFHVDRGILFTVKELFTRPGHMVREYIEGKRAKQFNYITLLLVITATYVFVAHSFHYSVSDSIGVTDQKKQIDKVQDFMLRNMKLTYLFNIPIIAAIIYMVFRRTGKNYAEMLVAITYLTCAESIIKLGMVLIILCLPKGMIAGTVMILGNALTIPYTFWFYRQFYDPFFSDKVALSLRVILAMVLPYILTGILLAFIFLILGQEKMMTFMHQLGMV